MKIQTQTTIELPTLPDKLKVEGGKRASLSIADVPDETLDDIVSEISEAWLKRAKVLRGAGAGE